MSREKPRVYKPGPLHEEANSRQTEQDVENFVSCRSQSASSSGDHVPATTRVAAGKSRVVEFAILGEAHHCHQRAIEDLLNHRPDLPWDELLDQVLAAVQPSEYDPVSLQSLKRSFDERPLPSSPSMEVEVDHQCRSSAKRRYKAGRSTSAAEPHFVHSELEFFGSQFIGGAFEDTTPCLQSDGGRRGPIEGDPPEAQSIERNRGL